MKPILMLKKKQFKEFGQFLGIIVQILLQLTLGVKLELRYSMLALKILEQNHCKRIVDFCASLFIPPVILQRSRRILNFTKFYQPKMNKDSKKEQSSQSSMTRSPNSITVRPRSKLIIPFDVKSAHIYRPDQSPLK